MTAKTMKVARVHGVNDMRVDDVALPAVGPRDVLVRMGATGICGSDLGYVAVGGLGGGVPLAEPLPLGHECAGEVVEVGAEVDGISPGLRCAVNPDFGGIGSGGPGAMAPFMVVREAEIGKALVPIPETLGFAEAALAEPLSVALHGIDLAGAGPGSKVAVLGAGSIGLSAVAMLRHRGVEDIVSVDLSDARLDRARQLGATATINPAREDFVAALGAAQGTGERFGTPFVRTDIFLDAAGSEKALQDAVSVAGYRAKIIVIALFKRPFPLDLWRVMANEIMVKGSIADSRGKEFAECLDMLADGAIDISPLVSHRLPFDEIGEAFRIAADADRSAKVILTYA